jgi:hypothetical protein
MAPAVTSKFEEVEPCGTVTELPGTGKSVLLLESDISVPPEGAAPVKVTVHAALEFEVKLVGVQESRETDKAWAVAVCAESKKIRVEICVLPCAECLRIECVI